MIDIRRPPRLVRRAYVFAQAVQRYGHALLIDGFGHTQHVFHLRACHKP